MKYFLQMIPIRQFVYNLTDKFFVSCPAHLNSLICNTENYTLEDVNKKIQLDATVRRHLFTAKPLYMFRASLRLSSGVLKIVTATSGIGHNIGAAASFQRGSSNQD
jgi:hypothetical protein